MMPCSETCQAGYLEYCKQELINSFEETYFEIEPGAAPVTIPLPTEDSGINCSFYKTFEIVGDSQGWTVLDEAESLLTITVPSQVEYPYVIVKVTVTLISQTVY